MASGFMSFFMQDFTAGTTANCDDFVDRFNHKYIRTILITFAIVLSTKQYVGDPIECWCPAQFTQNYIDFANKACWISNTYYVPLSEEIPQHNEKKNVVTYYQWTTFILFFQAILFYIPHSIWIACYSNSILNISSVLQSAALFSTATKATERIKMAEYLRDHLFKMFEMRAKRERRRIVRRRSAFETVLKHCFNFNGDFLVWGYIFTKILYIVNSVGQLYLLDTFMGYEYHWYGIKAANEIISTGLMAESYYFPRITLCDFQIRMVGHNINEYTVQCVLTINLFNEKIFMTVWWILMTSVMFSTASLVITAASMLVPHSCYEHVKRRIYVGSTAETFEEEFFTEESRKTRKTLMKRFVFNYLRRDGVFLFVMISENANKILSVELLNAIWDKYYSERRSNGRSTELKRSKTVPP